MKKAIMLTLVTLVMFMFLYDNQAYSGSYQEIEVGVGDTLWSIAANVTSEQQDIRKTIYHIQQANQLKGGSLQQGQILKVPKI